MCTSDEGCLLLLAQGGDGEESGICAVVRAAVACGHMLQNRHREKQQRIQQRLDHSHKDAPPPHPRPPRDDSRDGDVGSHVSHVMSKILDSVCRDSSVLVHSMMHDIVAGRGGLLDDAFGKVEEALVQSCCVIEDIVREAERQVLASEADAAAAAEAAAKQATTNAACPAPPVLKILASEPPLQTPPCDSWFCCSLLPPRPASCSDSSPAQSLFLLMRTIANLCGCGVSGSSNNMRKAVMQCGAAPFLVASLIPHACARVWKGGGGVLTMQPMVGLKEVTGEWSGVVRQEAAGALANLAFAPQARAALVKACILDVMEDVGYWTSVDGSLLESGSYANSGGGGSGINTGARLLHETSAFIERCASIVRSLSQEDACRRKIRSSSRLQELNALAPQQLHDYKFFKARADGTECIAWGESTDV